MDTVKLATAAAKFALASFWILLSFFVLTANIGDHPLRLSAKHRHQVVSWTPQGWAFFTRSAREPALRGYRLVDGIWEPASISNASYENAFGVSRRARAINAELHAIAAKVPQAHWLPCSEPLAPCVGSVRYEPAVVANAATRRSLCGLLALEMRPIVPWAWSAARDRISMPGSVAKVLVECET